MLCNVPSGIGVLYFKTQVKHMYLMVIMVVVWCVTCCCKRGGHVC